VKRSVNDVYNYNFPRMLLAAPGSLQEHLGPEGAHLVELSMQLLGVHKQEAALRTVAVRFGSASQQCPIP
jgi:hypothetical protein